jgi:hypothetical protein
VPTSTDPNIGPNKGNDSTPRKSDTTESNVVEPTSLNTRSPITDNANTIDNSTSSNFNDTNTQNTVQEIIERKFGKLDPSLPSASILKHFRSL